MAITEYGINVTNGVCVPWNPFDKNFDTQSDAEKAAVDYLIEFEEEQTAVVFRLEIVDGTIVSDTTLSCVTRQDMSTQEPVKTEPVTLH